MADVLYDRSNLPLLDALQRIAPAPSSWRIRA